MVDSGRLLLSPGGSFGLLVVESLALSLEENE